MTPEETTDRSLERLLAAQTPWGRARLNARVSWKRLSWLGVVNGTLFVKRALDIVGSTLALLLLAPAFLVIAVAAAEAAVGLAIVVGIFRNRHSVNLDELTLMKR